jgi:hypothetical protein
MAMSLSVVIEGFNHRKNCLTAFRVSRMVAWINDLLHC